MKYKALTKEQILISLDRLTRFKPTKEKYLRVFFDIILGNVNFILYFLYKSYTGYSADCRQ